MQNTNFTLAAPDYPIPADARLQVSLPDFNVAHDFGGVSSSCTLHFNNLRAVIDIKTHTVHTFSPIRTVGLAEEVSFSFISDQNPRALQFQLLSIALKIINREKDSYTVANGQTAATSKIKYIAHTPRKDALLSANPSVSGQSRYHFALKSHTENYIIPKESNLPTVLSALEVALLSGLKEAIDKDLKKKITSFLGTQMKINKLGKPSFIAKLESIAMTSLDPKTAETAHKRLISITGEMMRLSNLLPAAPTCL